MPELHRSGGCSRSLAALILAAVLLVPLSTGSAGAEEAPDVWTQVKKLYEKAKAAGDTVPSDVSEWVRQDLQNMNKWEYRIETLQAPGDQLLAKKLNDLGTEAWECFHVEREGKSVTLFCKRRMKSYLQVIPVRDLFRFVS
ncbi:MAG: hypothetical protein HYX75_19405 [Acidobacteria bacterium]|nr:hypothetical protein [Acidobacteriota bacterium]